MSQCALTTLAIIYMIERYNLPLISRAINYYISFMKREKVHEEESDHDEGQRKITKEERLLPKKKDYRMRAHINPLNTTPFPYPPHHSYVDWQAHYPLHFGGSL